MAARTSKLELETKLREKELLVERLERDRRWFAKREKEEREEKDREREAHEDEKVIVTHLTITAHLPCSLTNLIQQKSDSGTPALRISLTSLREELADPQDAHSALSQHKPNHHISENTNHHPHPSEFIITR